MHLGAAQAPAPAQRPRLLRQSMVSFHHKRNIRHRSPASQDECVGQCSALFVSSKKLCTGIHTPFDRTHVSGDEKTLRTAAEAPMAQRVPTLKTSRLAAAAAVRCCAPASWVTAPSRHAAAASAQRWLCLCWSSCGGGRCSAAAARCWALRRGRNRMHSLTQR